MTHRIAFRHQRAIFVFVVLGLIILFSTAVLWGHYETVVMRYQWLAKAGLALVDVIAIGLAIWHLYAKHGPLKVWCYIADAAIAAMMLVHAGAVLQLDASTAQQVAQVKAAADAQATLREADAKVEAARIKAAGEAAAAIKQQTGSNALAGQAIKNAATKQDTRAAEALTKMAADVKPTTFMSDEYMRGGVYYWPALIALGFFVVAIGISAFSLPYEDANANGIPDWLERIFGRRVEADRAKGLSAYEQSLREIEENYRRYGRSKAPDGDVEPQPITAGYKGERTYRVLPNGDQEVVQSTFSPDEVGMVIPKGVKAPAESMKPKPRVTWRGGVRIDGPQEPKGNGADRSH
jgi:hypothetical protein